MLSSRPLCRRVLTTLVFVTVLAGMAHAQDRRVALIIGNSAYKSVDRLLNPANDARLIAATLRESGFTIIGNGPLLDLDKARFERSVQEFGRALQGADVALFYYSGHGMQVDGVNWLVPIDANPTGPLDLDFQMVNAGLILRQMEGAGTKLNMLLLDACRNNPFAVRGVRGAQPGLAEMRAPEGTLISYATQPGNVAADGSSANSPYAAALAAAIRRPGLEVFQVFNTLGLSVKQATAGQQQPWLASSPISGTFYFFNGPVTIQPPPVPVDEGAIFWQSIATSSDPEDFQSYLRRFPHGTYAELAERRMAALRTKPPVTTNQFDGNWSVTMTCTAASDGTAGYSRRMWVSIQNGGIHGEDGTRSQANYLALDGKVQSDGDAFLRGSGLTGASATTFGHPPPGSNYTFQARVRFDGRHALGTRIDARRCELEFVKQ